MTLKQIITVSKFASDKLLHILNTSEKNQYECGCGTSFSSKVFK